jgi:hypothetical protein
MEGESRLDRRRYLAARSEVGLRPVCESLRARYGFPPFWYDCEAEGADSWTYAHSAGESLGFNVTQIEEFVNPSLCTWMWGAPDQANYQIILYWDSSRLRSEDVAEIESVLAELLQGPIIPYPGSGFGCANCPRLPTPRRLKHVTPAAGVLPLIAKTWPISRSSSLPRRWRELCLIDRPRQGAEGRDSPNLPIHRGRP